MDIINERALNFIIDAAAQKTEICCDEEVIFLIGLVMEQQKRQLDAAFLERFKLMIADYEAALLVRKTLPLLTP